MGSIPPIVVMGVHARVARSASSWRHSSASHSSTATICIPRRTRSGWRRALSDAKRLPWLRSVCESLATVAAPGVVVACSARKRSDRDLLRTYAPAMFAVYAQGDIALIRARIEARTYELMPLSLLKTQFDDLEELQDDEVGLTVDISKSPEQIVEAIITAIHLRSFRHED